MQGSRGSPASSSTERQVFTIRPGQSAAAVGDELQGRGLIRSALAFRWEVESRGIGSKLGAGDYELSPNMSTSEIVSVLARGAVSHGTSLTILEGWRAEQTAIHVEELQLGKAEDLMQLIRSPREYGLMPPDGAATSLEGYLYPETYEFDPQVAPNQLIDAMLRQFGRHVNDAIRQQAASSGLTTSQLVTLASIIEREAVRPAERPLIASVYVNRLAAGMKLQADPTVQFSVASLDLAAAIGYGFWKKELAQEDLEVNFPYNTYRVAGFPPGPICSPGIGAIQAAANPANTRFIYFVARGDGSHAFAETSEEHVANVHKFRQ